MNEVVEQIKIVIYNLSYVSDMQYNHLVSIFGENNVIEAIKELYLEDNSILLKFEKNVLDLFIDLEDSTILAYYYYIKDIKKIGKKSKDERYELFKDINIILKKLNKLFDYLEIISADNKKKTLWVSDKVEYCINNYSDLKLLGEIKVLYNQYIEKRNILLETYLKFVVMTAKSFCSVEQRIPLDDLIQYGNIGLIRAIELYDIEKDIEFLTYANYWIRQSIMYNSKKVYNQIKVPLRFYDIKVKRGKIFELLIQHLGRYPTNDELILVMREDENKVNMIMNLFKPFVSLDELTEDGVEELSDVVSNGMNLSKIDFIVDKTIDLDKDIIYNELSSEIEYYMNLCLNEREKFILKARFGFINEISVLELAKMYDVSEQRIYQIIQGAFKKLYQNKEFRKMKVYLR